MSSSLSTLVADRLARNKFATDQEMVNAAKEVVQEIALLGLSRQGFFDRVAFQGGTAFRIIHGLDRFSEDLDFALLARDPDFKLADLLEPLKDEFEHWGLSLEISLRTKMDVAVQQAFLKETSLGAVLALESALPDGQKLKIKIELDINPPSGAVSESKLCHFPTDFYVTCHDQPTMLAGKLHALLCRTYLKGRDWYDFVEYLRRSVKPNVGFLQAALEQIGPWDGRAVPPNIEINWVCDSIAERMRELSVGRIVEDVRPFVHDEQKISLWSEKYFQEKISYFQSMCSES